MIITKNIDMELFEKKTLTSDLGEPYMCWFMSSTTYDKMGTNNKPIPLENP